MNEHLGHVLRFDRLAGRRLARAQRDRVVRVGLIQEPDVRRAGERELDRLLALIAQPITNASRQAFVRDADVLADPEARHRGEEARRRLERERYGARFALRRE